MHRLHKSTRIGWLTPCRETNERVERGTGKCPIRQPNVYLGRYSVYPLGGERDLHRLSLEWQGSSIWEDHCRGSARRLRSTTLRRAPDPRRLPAIERDIYVSFFFSLSLFIPSSRSPTLTILQLRFSNFTVNPAVPFIFPRAFDTFEHKWRHKYKF